MHCYFYHNNSDNRYIDKDLSLITIEPAERHYLGQLCPRVTGEDSHISCSSYGYYSGWSDWYDWGAFTDDIITRWNVPETGTSWTNGNNEQNPWIAYHFDEPRYFTKIELNVGCNYGGDYTGQVIIEASNDGEMWFDISGGSQSLYAPYRVINTNTYILDSTSEWLYIRVRGLQSFYTLNVIGCFFQNIYVYGGETITPQKDFLDVYLKSDENAETLTLELAYNENILNNANYCYIEDLGKFYYMSEPTFGKNRVYYPIKCDLLMTFSNEIKDLECIIARQENNYNAYISDDRFPVLGKQQVNTLVFPYGFSNHDELLLIVNGQ